MTPLHLWTVKGTSLRLLELVVISSLIPFGRQDTSETGFDRIKNLEDDQERLTSSLQALTSHFAQVQFRLRQIVETPQTGRDDLLRDLEEFAFRGIPEVTRLNPEDQDDINKIRTGQFELIEHLKRQLSEVERFAYESGAKVLPQSMLVEKQKVLIDELKIKLNLNVTEDELPELSVDDLRQHVDNALGEFVMPLKMKDTLVGQLKTQIVDLERFVAYLQCEQMPGDAKAITDGTNADIPLGTYNSKMAKNRRQSPSCAASTSSKGTTSPLEPPRVEQTLTNKVSSLLDRASAMLNIFALTQLGCSSGRFQKNTLKRTTKGNHWGDLRAQLEVDVQETVALMASVKNLEESVTDKDLPSYRRDSSDSEDGSDFENVSSSSPRV